MKSRWLLNLGLALFVGALLVAVRFAPHRHQHSHRPPLTILTPDAVTGIRLIRPGHPPIVLAKQGSHWRIVSPTPARADRFRIDGLLHVATAEVHDSFPETAAGLGKYGLDQPQMVLWLNDQKVEFGGTSAVGDFRYVLYHGRIDLIPSYSFSPASVQLSNFFSTRLVEKDWKPVAFTFPKFRLISRNGIWHMDPADNRLSTDAINSFVDEWRYARALSVNRYSGKPVIAHILIRYIDRNSGPKDMRHTLDIGILTRKPELVLYRRDEGLDYHFPAQIGRHLLRLSASR